MVLAVDVAKVQQYALLTNQEHTQTWLIQWQALEAIVESDEELREMRLTVGKGTAVLISLHLDPRCFATPKSYQKAFGVNLTEKSSGQINGQLILSKRGSAIARKFLYLATLRLLVNDPMVGKWYEAKKDERAKLNKN